MPVDAFLRGIEPLIALQVHAQVLGLVCEGVAPSMVARADPEKLEQVLLALLPNAVKLAPTGGMITVVGESVGGPTGESGDTQAPIRVGDTGIGIAGNHLDGVFEPFVQLDQRLTRLHEGVGLGPSATSWRAASAATCARSTEGAGSTFALALRRAAQTLVVVVQRLR